MLVMAAAAVVWGISIPKVSILSVFNHKAAMFGAMSAFAAFAIAFAARPSSKGTGLSQSRVNPFFMRHQGWFVLCFFIAYSVVMSVAALLRHEAFQSHAFDLAIFDQAVWSTLKGNLLSSSFK